MPGGGAARGGSLRLHCAGQALPAGPLPVGRGGTGQGCGSMCPPLPARRHLWAFPQERNVTFSARLTKMETRMYSAFNGVGEPSTAWAAGVWVAISFGVCFVHCAWKAAPEPHAGLSDRDAGSPKSLLSRTIVQRRALRRAPRSWAASCQSAAAGTRSCRLELAPRRPWSRPNLSAERRSNPGHLPLCISLECDALP